MNIIPHHGTQPAIHPSAYVHPSAQIIGEVRLGVDVSVWCNAVIRGDVNRIEIGAGSLVPEGKTLQSGYLYLGRPAKQLRLLTAEELAYFDYSANHYIELARSYR